MCDNKEDSVEELDNVEESAVSEVEAEEEVFDFFGALRAEYISHYAAHVEEERKNDMELVINLSDSEVLRIGYDTMKLELRNGAASEYRIHEDFVACKIGEEGEDTIIFINNVLMIRLAADTFDRDAFIAKVDKIGMNIVRG